MTDEREGLPSASGLYKIAACPRSWTAEEGEPNETGEAAEAGTLIHAALEGEPTWLNSEQTDMADMVKRLEAKVLRQIFGSDEPEIFLREERLWMTDGIFPVMSGKPDVIYHHDGGYLILDYKTGRVEPESAEANWQLKSLAVMLADKLDGKKYGSIFAAIVQPLATFSPCIVHFSAEQIEEARVEILAALDEANDEFPKAKAGKHCRFCRAKTTCSASIGAVSSIAKTDIGSWPALTGRQKSKLLKVAQTAQKIADALIKKCKADLIAGGEIEGFQLRPGRKRREIDGDEAAKILAGEGLSGDEIRTAYSLNLTKLKEVWSDFKRFSGDDRTSREIIAELDAKLEKATIIKEDQPTIEEIK